MNDKTLMQAIRKLPSAWVSNDTHIGRFGNAICAASPNFAPMQFVDGKWRKIDVTAVVRR